MSEVTLTLPANWKEVIDAGKYPDVITVLNADLESEADQRMMMLIALTDLTGKKLIKQWGVLSQHSQEQVSAQIVANVFPALDFIFYNEPFFDNPIPYFKWKGKVFKGPGYQLHDQLGEQWMITHQQQVLYNNTKDIDHLHQIIAANYTTSGKFSEEEMVKNVELLTDLPESYAYGIYLWYQHSDNWWFKKFPHLFTSDNQESAPVPADGFEVRDILFEMAGNKLDAGWDLVKRRTRQDIFYALDRLDEKRSQFEEAMQK